MQIQCYKSKKDFECNPEGKCWCKDFDYKILDKDINNKMPCMCNGCLEKFIK